MSCSWVDEHLDDWLDGELPLPLRRRLEAHLAACPGCRSVAEGLESLSRRAGALPPSIEPRRDLWPAISRLLPASGSEPAGRDRFYRVGRWAAALLVAGAGALLWSFLGGDPGGLHPGRSSSPAAPVKELPSASGAGPGARLSPAGSNAELEALRLAALQDLPAEPAFVGDQIRILDEAIREILRAIDEDPGNPWLQHALGGTYRKQLELLRLAHGFSEPGSSSANHRKKRRSTDELV